MFLLGNQCHIVSPMLVSALVFLWLQVMVHFLITQEYFKICPENFRDEDVYVCESRYSAKTKSFKKIKLWTMPVSSVRFRPREIPLPVVRVASVFAHKDKVDEDAASENMEDTKDEDITICLEKVCILIPVHCCSVRSNLHTLIIKRLVPNSATSHFSWISAPLI